MHPDRRDLLLANASASEGPNARKFADPLRWNAEVLARQDERLFHQPDEVHRPKMWSTVTRQVAAQVEDGITRQLAGPVIRNVSATVDLMDLDAALSQRLIASKNVRARRIPPDRKHRRMLHQHKRVANRASLSRSNHLRLNAQSFSIGNAAELEQMNVHANRYSPSSLRLAWSSGRRPEGQ